VTILSVKQGLVEKSMRHTVLAAVFALSASALFSFGCGSGTTPTANSFTEVYTKTIQPKCSNDFCHYNGVDIRFSALDLSSKVRAYSSLVNQLCMASVCAQNGMRVLPGQPEASVMYTKVLDPLPDAGINRCGTEMPADKTGYSTNGNSDLTFSGPPLSTEEQQRIYDWIQEGAKDN
jgi:hypothetical protein